MAGHIIHKQIFQIGVAAEDRANHTGDAVKDMYVQKVLPELDRIFTELSPEDKIYRFNRIEIDLGIMPEEELGPELPDRLTQRIKHAVSEGIEQVAFQTRESRKMEVIPVSASLFDAFLHYLEFGILPWWQKVEDGKQPRYLFKNLPASYEQSQLLKLRQILKKKAARTRLAQQFSDDIFSGILTAMQTAGTKRPENEGNQEPVLFSEFLSAMIDTLEKLRIPKDIRAVFRIEMMREMLDHKMALSHFPQEFDPDKTDKALRDFIASGVNILIKSLALHGTSAAKITSLLTRIRELTSDKSITGYGFSQQTFTKKKIEEIVKKAQKETIEKNASEKPDSAIDEEEKPYADQSGIYIQNGGAVLLWPFLKNYFHKLGLLADEKFKSTKEQHRAALLLQYAVTGKREFPEYLLPLNKIIFGIPVDEPLKTEIKISKTEKAETEAMIQSAIQTWKAIGKVSVEGFRESFLQREGRLKLTSNGWSLKVERKTIDILMDKLPWMISMVKLNWMKQIIYVDW